MRLAGLLNREDRMANRPAKAYRNLMLIACRCYFPIVPEYG
ncbi:hypothetical protein OMCYN_00767 [cyanobiont of Ornithocercus magnificus]|nr:hypothetical protein OMCYN_00767 [cyanobiont of Ornithocercus magnificus]